MFEKKKLIIDGDALAFLMAFRRPDEDGTPHTVENTVAAAGDYIRGIMSKLGPVDPIIVIESIHGVENPRHLWFKGYKDRDGSAKTELLLAVKQKLSESPVAEWVCEWEADDVICELLTASPDSWCLYVDKDLRQVPGRFINMRTPGKYLHVKDTLGTVDEKTFSGVCGLLVQAIGGDKADTYPGIDIPVELMAKYMPTVAQVKQIAAGKEPTGKPKRAATKTAAKLLTAMADAGCTVGDVVKSLGAVEDFQRNIKLATMYSKQVDTYYRELLGAHMAMPLVTEPTVEVSL